MELLTHCRILGYVFNPVSFFYCYDLEDRLALSVAEVNNTYGDRHCYVLPVEGAAFEWRTKKLMHVSPFFEPDAGTYRWELPAPGERIEAGVDLTRDGRDRRSAPASRWRAVRSPTPTLASALLRFPFVTLKVMAAIHFEALRLWLKGARFDRPSLRPGAGPRRSRMIADPFVARAVVSRLLPTLRESWRVGRLSVRAARRVGHDARTAKPPSRRAQIRVKHPAFFRRFLLAGDLGVGESYMDGEWEADDLATFLTLAPRNEDGLASSPGSRSC